MFELGIVPLGITLFLLGVGLFFLAYIILRLVSRFVSSTTNTKQSPLTPELPDHENAVIIVQSGGRIQHMNQEARHKFDIWHEAPNLERLARRTRPMDTFLNLCATEGKATLSINGQMMEGISYFVPNGNDTTVLLTIRDQRNDGSFEGERDYSDHTVEVLTALNQSMAANLELEDTLEAILRLVDQLLPSDFCEVTVWDPDKQHLVPYRLVGIPGMDQRIDLSDERYPFGNGYSGNVAALREPILISDVDAYRDYRPLIDRKKYPFHSYLGLPLLVGGELIGTLALTSLDRDAFSEKDVEELSLVSGQAAIALHNALLYREEKRRALELSSLANLTQVVSSVQDPEELFARLSQGISPLLDVEIAGFFIFEDVHRKLVAQNPFIGIPPQFVDLYQVDIPADSPADKIWRDQETLVITNAGEDPTMIDLGLDHSARAAGIKNTVLVPLKSGGRSLGYLQAANKRDKTTFTEDDIRLLSIVAGQAAPIIENVDLVQQSIQRALRAEALRRIASLSGSEADLDEILKYSIIELSRLLKVDAAAIFFLNENLAALDVHRESIYGVPEELYDQLGRIPIDERYSKYMVSVSKRPFITTNTLAETRVLPPYQTLMNTFKVKSAIDVPLVFRGRGVGELMLASDKQDHFSRSDVQLASTVAGQLAVAVERTSLASQTDSDLRRRVDQLTSLTRIGRELHASLNIKRLLQHIHKEALQTTNADCGTIMLLEDDPLDNIDTGIQLHVGDDPGKDLHPLEKIVLQKNAPILIEDFSDPPKNLDESTLRPAHPGVHSAMIVPIAYQTDVVGIIHLHAEKPGRFDETALQIAQVLAVQAAVAIGNVQRYQEQVDNNLLLKKRADVLSDLLSATDEKPGERSMEIALEKVAKGLRAATSSPAVLIGVCQHNQRVTWISCDGIADEPWQGIFANDLEWVYIEKYLRAEYLLGTAYSISLADLDELPDWMSVLVGERSEKASLGAVILLPLLKSTDEPLGIIAMANPREQDHPDRATLEILSDFTRQTTNLIDNHLWTDQLQIQVQNLEEQLEHSKHDDVQEVDQEQIEQSQERVNAILEIFEIISRQPDRSAVLKSLAREFMTRLGLDLSIVVEMREGGPHLLDAFGDTSRKSNLDALLGQRNPLSVSLSERRHIFVPDVDASEEWTHSPLIQALKGKGFISIPITAQAGAPAAVLGVSSSVLADFLPGDEKLFDLLTTQTATALNNLTLLEETGQRLKEVYLLLDFSRQMGGLEPERVLGLLVESALEVVLPAQASMIAVSQSETGKVVPQKAMGYSDNEALLNVAFHPTKSILGQVLESKQPTRIGEVDFAQQYNLEKDGLISYREATDGVLPVSSLILPVKSGKGVFGVLVLENFQDTDAFSPDDQALVASLVRQASLTLENIELYQSTEERAMQLETLSTVSAAMTATLELDGLVNSLLEVLQSLIPYDTGTLWMRSGDTLSIQSACGFENSTELIGLETSVADSRLFDEMVSTNKPIHVEDIRQDERFPEIGAERFSWLAVPMSTKGEVMGVIALEKTEPRFYRPEHVQVLSTFANQAAVAMENADLYHQSLKRSLQLDRRTQRLALINRFSNQISSTLDVERLLAVTSDELSNAVSCSMVSAARLNNEQLVLHYQIPQKELHLPHVLPTAPIVEHLQQSLGVFSTVDVFKEELLEPLQPYFKQTETVALLVIPLVTGEDVQGFIFIHSDREYRFSADEVELARILTNQAAVAIQNAVLYTQTHQLTEALEERVEERTQQLAREHTRAQSLLRIMQELSASLDLDHVLNRTLKLLNEVTEAEQSTILLTKPDESTFYYRASLGYTEPPPLGGRSTDLDVDEGLAGWIVRRRIGVVIKDLRDDDRWIYTADLNTDHRSVMGAPLLVGAELLGVMLMFHRNPAHFDDDHLEMAQAAANQIAVSINNAELFNLIREQAERLGTMLRTQQVETSRSRAILEAVANGVLVTDSDGKITLFNSSAQSILGLRRNQVVGNSLESFSGLFGANAQIWMNTISAWSSAPTGFEDGDTFAERIILDDGRVVAIHLAPVRMNDEFLGTVSIFRDITHQVEVDRLKSEFVATVSHELRTPMTSIKGYVEILLMGAAGDLNEQQTQFLDVVLSNTLRLNVLVNDLLDVSRIDAGKADLVMQPLRLQELVEEVVGVQLEQSETDQKPITIEYDMPAETPRVLGDEERVRQILANLISNAYHYTPANGHVLLKAKTSGDEIQIDVTDDGIGIHPDDQERVFERFYRGEDPLVLATAGTGLGLSIVQQLVEMHQGKIWVSSKGIPGEGSTFSVTLPIYHEENI